MPSSASFSMSMSRPDDRVYDQEVRLNNIFDSLSEGFRKLDKLNESKQQNALKEMTAQMQEAKSYVLAIRVADAFRWNLLPCPLPLSLFLWLLFLASSVSAPVDCDRPAFLYKHVMMPESLTGDESSYDIYHALTSC